MLNLDFNTNYHELTMNYQKFFVPSHPEKECGMFVDELCLC
jgi:hypothetical protein